MQLTRVGVALVVAFAISVMAAGQTPSPPGPPTGQKPPTNGTPVAPGGPGGPGGQGRRSAVQVMTLTSTAWPDGGHIPARHSQNGAEVSPALNWSNVPDGTASFVLIAHDVDAAVGNGTEDVLHWLLWNIPGASRGLPEALPQGSQLPDGTRQISVSGPYYRGPGAAAAGPPHHYVFELFALDSMLDVAALGQTPAQTRAAVMAAMAAKVRGKAAYVGLFKR